MPDSGIRAMTLKIIEAHVPPEAVGEAHAILAELSTRSWVEEGGRCG